VGKHFGLDLSPLRTSRDYRLVFLGGSVSAFGSFITYVTIPYQVAKLTDDPLMVGLLGVCELVPLLVMAFVGGALADYIDRRPRPAGEAQPVVAGRSQRAQIEPQAFAHGPRCYVAGA